MVRGREWSAESGTSLTIGHERIGKEQTGLGCKAIGNLTSLTHEAVLHLHRIVDGTTITDNRVFTDDTSTDKHRCIHRRHHRTLRETGSTADFTVALDNGIRDILGIDDLHIITNVAPFRTRYSQLILNHLLEGLLQFLVTLMLHHEGSHLTVQLTEDRDIPIAHLVEDANHRTLAISGIISGFEGADIRDVTVVTDRVVVDVVTHLLNQTVISYRDITQGSIIDT